MKFKSQISILMLLIITLGIIPLELSYGQNQGIETYETFYFLDMGFVPLWKHSNGSWQNNIKPGDYYKKSVNYSLLDVHNALNGEIIKADDIELVNIKAYTPDLFSFDQENFRRWSNSKAITESDYIYNFFRRSANDIRIEDKSYDSKTGQVLIEWNAKLTPNQSFLDVKTTIDQAGVQELYEYLGGESNVSQDLKDSIEKSKPDKFDSNVEGYFCFIPTVVEYRVKKTIENNDPKYIFSAFNNHSVTHNQPNPHDPRKYTFWLFRPIDAAKSLEDEFLIEGHSWIYKGNKYTEKETFPLKNFKLNKESPVATYEFYADFVPISVVIWRKGVEDEKYIYRDNFKKNFWAGYTKTHNGETYYYYDTWDAEADGEFYPGTLLDDYTDPVVQQFLNPLGYTSKDTWKQEPWKN